MRTSAANELKQIKIQDQVRDLKEGEAKLRSARRRNIGNLIQGLFLMLLAFMISNISFVFSLFLGAIDFSKFSLPGYIVLFLLVLSIALADLANHIYSGSKQISEIELGIQKRLYALKKMSSGS